MSKTSYFFTFAIVVLLAIFTTSCNPAVEKLKREVEATNAECPINGGSFGDMISVKYSDQYNQVTIYWALNEGMVTIDFLSSSEEDVRTQMKLMLQEESSRKLLNDLVAADASLAFVYKAPSTGKTAQFVLSAEELKAIKNAPAMPEEERLMLFIKNQVMIDDKKCPYSVEEGIRMTKVDLVNGNVVYYCEIDDDLYDLRQLKYMGKEMKQGVVGTFKESLKTDVVIQNQIKSLFKLGMGVHYRYYGKNSQEALDVILSPDELYALMPEVAK